MPKKRTLVAASVTPMMLSLLAQGETYGYQLIKRIATLSDGKIRWTPSTLYPVLHRLEAQGLIASTWRTSESGHERKYYRLTPKGARALETERQEWLDVHEVLVKLWNAPSAGLAAG